MRHFNKDGREKKSLGGRAVKGIFKLLLANPIITTIVVVVLVAVIAYTLYSIDYQLTQIMTLYQSLSARTTNSKADYDKRLFFVTTDSNGNKTVTVGYRSELEKEEADKNLVDAGVGPGNKTSIDVNISGWYTDVTSGEASTSVQTVNGKYRLYDGPPWDVTPGTYIFNYPQAKEDTFNMISSLNISGNPLTSDDKKYKATALSSTVNTPGIAARWAQGWTTDEGTRLKEINGVYCIPFCPMPACIDRTYVDGGKWAQTSTPDASLYNYGNKKCALIVVENLADVNDSSKWLYFPMTTIDAKAHTYPWGVVQTNIKILSSTKLQFSRDWSGTSTSSQYNKEYEGGIGTDDAVYDAIVNVVQGDEMQKKKNFDIWTWHNHGVELYNTDSKIVSFMNKYYAVGFMIWGD